VYVRSRESKRGVYWDCEEPRNKECAARAITAVPRLNQDIIVFKGPEESPHDHPPNREASDAEVFRERIKRKTAEHPEQPPAQLLQTEIASVPDGV